MPRLFTGLEIPDDVARDLARARGGLTGARWIDPADYHVTVRFIGAVDADVARAIDASLLQLQSPVFAFVIDRFAVFGHDKPHALVALVARSAALSRLAAAHETEMRRLGLPPEKRVFTPHVTLARLSGARAPEVAAYLERLGSFPPRRVMAERATLFSARPPRGGGPYVAEAFYPLSPAPTSSPRV